MTMKVTRVLHPVGHGGFYTERIESNGKTFNMVYDCGGASGKFMKSYIDKYYADNSTEHIDAVFISHLHADHINGLKYLLEKVKVDYLFLPQLSNDIVIESFIHNICNQNDYKGSNQLISDFANPHMRYYGRFNTKIIHISPNAEFNCQKSDYYPWYENQGDVQDVKFNLVKYKGKKTDLSASDVSSIESGDMLSFGSWMYIPFNPTVPTKFGRISEDIYFKDIITDDVIDFAKLQRKVRRDGIEKVKNLYSLYFGARNHNSYSMTLYSGLSNDEEFKSHLMPSYLYFIDQHLRHFDHPMCPNCLYTGDFEPQNNMADLHRCYGNLHKNIRWIQVPHHGSRNNWDSDLYNGYGFCFMSVGVDDRHNHPNIDTLIRLRETDYYPIIITEDINTMTVASFDIR